MFHVSNQIKLLVLILLIVTQKQNKQKKIPPRLGLQGFIFVKSRDMVKGTKTFHPPRYASVSSTPFRYLHHRYVIAMLATFILIFYLHTMPILRHTLRFDHQDSMVVYNAYLSATNEGS